MDIFSQAGKTSFTAASSFSVSNDSAILSIFAAKAGVNSFIESMIVLIFHTKIPAFQK